jgi:hypothetical protein
MEAGRDARPPLRIFRQDAGNLAMKKTGGLYASGTAFSRDNAVF